MGVGIVMVVVAVTVVLVLLTRMQNKNKAVVVAEIASDREASKPPDILELVNQEVQEAGIGSLAGADGVDSTVLLKVWKRDGTGCAGEQGTFVLSEGLAPEEASEDTLRFECGGDPKRASDLQAADPSGATE